MLTSETKQKINNCRDYLVWKIPDPKWQIDQITNALIYKFMSDQDALAKEIWWKATFFVDQIQLDDKWNIKKDKEWKEKIVEYEKYSWSKLFDTTLTNEGKAKLYISWIEQLSKAKHLPELFRDIFKDAFLPFRDANTIVLFLTEINKFDYHHSEELWNAFEYLLSIMWSQWNAGQFRTPRHIIDFLVDVVDPKPGETIYDPACGTAGFLISAYNHILENNPKISVSEKLELSKNISWVDIDPGMAKIARVNLYLHGFKTPKITEDDTLSNEKLWENKFDVILANPPFMTPKWGIKPHEGYTIKSTKAEVLFTDYIAEHLKLKWRAWIVVPEWIIFQSANAYKDLRKLLIEEKMLYAVVSLPSWVFQPYSWVKTSILFLDRELASKTDKVLFVKVENDWFDLWAQRRPINKDDLPKTLKILQNYKVSVLENTDFKIEDKNVLLVEKSKISENWEYNLSAERYREAIVWNSDFEMVELGDVCEILDNLRKPISKGDRVEWKYPYYWATWIVDYINDYIFDEKLVLVWEDWAKWWKWDKTAFIIEWKNWVNNHAHVLRVNKTKLKDELLVELLNWMDLSQYITWITVPKLNQKNLREIKIPLPPLEIQEQIVEELDNYQKIIDGAKQIVENYKPRIKIDKSWDVVELGEVCEIWSWWTPSKSNELYWNSNDIPWLRSEVCKDKYVYEANDFISNDGFKNSSAKLFKPETTLIALVWATIWKTAFLTFESTTNQNIAWLYPKNTNKLDTKFLFFISQNLYDKFINLWNWDFKMASLWFIKNLKIPLPLLEIQEQIVAKIEEEQKLIESNKKLIEIFEKKIEEKISEIWGENLEDND